MAAHAAVPFVACLGDCGAATRAGHQRRGARQLYALLVGVPAGIETLSAHAEHGATWHCLAGTPSLYLARAWCGALRDADARLPDAINAGFWAAPEVQRYETRRLRVSSRTTYKRSLPAIAITAVRATHAPTSHLPDLMGYVIDMGCIPDALKLSGNCASRFAHCLLCHHITRSCNTADVHAVPDSCRPCRGSWFGGYPTAIRAMATRSTNNRAAISRLMTALSPTRTVRQRT